MTVSLDDMGEEMLRGECSSGGTGAALQVGSGGARRGE